MTNFIFEGMFDVFSVSADTLEDAEKKALTKLGFDIKFEDETPIAYETGGNWFFYLNENSVKEALSELGYFYYDGKENYNE